MPTVDKEIEVNAPVERVYQMWTNYESFPNFMDNVKEVRRIGPDRTHWVVETAGRTVEWDARTITENLRRVAWTAEGEAGQSGEVRFEPAGPNKTRLKVRMDYSLPSGLQEKVAHGLHLDERAVGRDLDNFKEIIEGSGSGAGGGTYTGL